MAGAAAGSADGRGSTTGRSTYSRSSRPNSVMASHPVTPIAAGGGSITRGPSSARGNTTSSAPTIAELPTTPLFQLLRTPIDAEVINQETASGEAKSDKIEKPLGSALLETIAFGDVQMCRVLFDSEIYPESTGSSLWTSAIQFGIQSLQEAFTSLLPPQSPLSAEQKLALQYVSFLLVLQSSRGLYVKPALAFGSPTLRFLNKFFSEVKKSPHINPFSTGQSLDTATPDSALPGDHQHACLLILDLCTTVKDILTPQGSSSYFDWTWLTECLRFSNLWEMDAFVGYHNAQHPEHFAFSARLPGASAAVDGADGADDDETRSQFSSVSRQLSSPTGSYNPRAFSPLDTFSQQQKERFSKVTDLLRILKSHEDKLKEQVQHAGKNENRLKLLAWLSSQASSNIPLPAVVNVEDILAVTPYKRSKETPLLLSEVVLPEYYRAVMLTLPVPAKDTPHNEETNVNVQINPTQPAFTAFLEDFDNPTTLPALDYPVIILKQLLKYLTELGLAKRTSRVTGDNCETQSKYLNRFLFACPASYNSFYSELCQALLNGVLSFEGDEPSLAQQVIARGLLQSADLRNAWLTLARSILGFNTETGSETKTLANQLFKSAKKICGIECTEEQAVAYNAELYAENLQNGAMRLKAQVKDAEALVAPPGQAILKIVTTNILLIGQHEEEWREVILKKFRVLQSAMAEHLFADFSIDAKSKHEAATAWIIAELNGVLKHFELLAKNQTQSLITISHLDLSENLSAEIGFISPRATHAQAIIELARTQLHLTLYPDSAKIFTFNNLKWSALTTAVGAALFFFGGHAITVLTDNNNYDPRLQNIPPVFTPIIIGAILLKARYTGIRQNAFIKGLLSELSRQPLPLAGCAAATRGVLYLLPYAFTTTVWCLTSEQINFFKEALLLGTQVLSASTISPEWLHHGAEWLINNFVSWLQIGTDSAVAINFTTAAITTFSAKEAIEYVATRRGARAAHLELERHGVTTTSPTTPPAPPAASTYVPLGSAPADTEMKDVANTTPTRESIVWMWPDENRSDFSNRVGQQISQ